MIDHEAALRFDAALDGFVRGEHTSEDPLMNTARAIHQIDASQRGVPSDAFRAQLRGVLSGDGTVDHLNGHHPVAEGTIPVPLPERPAQLRSSHRWLVIAAALLLLLTGGGAIVLEGIGLHNDSEPSAIPAVSFASPDVDEQATGSPGATDTAMSLAPLVPMALSDGTLYRIERDMGDAKFTGLRAYRTEDSKRLWEVADSDFGNLLVAAGELVFTTLKPDRSESGQIVAYDARSGDVVWTMPSGGTITGLTESDGVLYAVDSTGSVAAVDAASGALRWTTKVDTGTGSVSGGAGPTIVTAPGYVAAVTPLGTLAVVDRANGKVAWTKDGYQQGAAMLAATTNMLFVVNLLRYYVVDEATPYAIGISPGASPPAGATPFSQFYGNLRGVSGVGWSTTQYYLGNGGFFVSGGSTELTAPPAAIGDVIAIPGKTLNTGGLTYGLGGQSSRDSGQVTVSLPEGIQGKRIVQLGTWTPPGGAPEQFVAVTDDGILTLVSPKHLGIVDNADQPDPYDGAVVDLGQPVISQPIGDESGIWVTLADGTLLSIHPQRLLRSATQQLGTPTPGTNSGETWIAHRPDKTEHLGEDGNAHVIDDGRVFRAFASKSDAQVVQAIDAHTGNILWETEIDSSGRFMIASSDVLLVAGKDDKGSGHLVALDAATGQNVWTTDLSDEPVGMTVAETTALMLGSSDTLDATDIETGQTVYSVDVHGEAKTVGPTVSRDRYIAEHRMAVDGETLYATLADGSVVAVDWETGAGKWWSLRSIPGQVQVYVVDGVVVTVDQGELRKIQSGYITKSLAERTATPIPATPSPLAFSPTCNANDAPASPAATPFSTGTGGAVNATYRGLDPTTGAVLWANSIPGVSAGQLDVDSGILTIMFDLVEGSTEPPEFAYCLVDADSGQISNFDPLDDVSAPILRIESSSYLGEDWRLGIVIDGYILPVPPEYAEGIAGTVVVFGSDVEDALKDGWFWQEAYENRIYYSTMDGDLVSIPIPDE